MFAVLACVLLACTMVCGQGSAPWGSDKEGESYESFESRGEHGTHIPPHFWIRMSDEQDMQCRSAAFLSGPLRKGRGDHRISAVTYKECHAV